jgi:hypothetical protein
MYRISLLLACLAALLSADFSALATVKSWNHASGGTWFSPSSWTPSGVPGSADSVSITLNGMYTVTIDSHRVTIARLVLGAITGIQALRIIAPADSLILTGSSVIGGHGNLNVGQNVLMVAGWPDTLTNSGTISVDSVGNIGLSSDCYLTNLLGGSVLLNGSADIMGDFNGQALDSYVENSGSITKSGGDTLTLYCVYDQLSGGTLSLQGGMLRAWVFTTNGLVTLASGTATRMNSDGVWGWAGIDTGGVVDMQGTASISGDIAIENRGELRHTLAGTSVFASPYQPHSPPNDGEIRVMAGKLSMTHSNGMIEGLVVISASADLEVFNGSFLPLSSLTSAAADSGTLTLGGDYMTGVYGIFSFSGILQISGFNVTFNPATDPVNVRSFTIEPGAYFHSSVTIQTDSVNMNGGTMDADVVIAGHYSWTAGDFVGSGGSTITIAAGTTLDVHGPTTKNLNTRDLVISGTASVSGSGQFSMSGGASIVVDAAGSLTVGDSITITGTGDSLINHGQLTFNCPQDTATIGAFLSNLPTGRTTGTIDILSGQVVCASADNMGTVNMHPGSELRVEGQWNNDGLLVMSNGSRCVVSGILENGSSGVIHLNGGAEILGSGLVNNAGLVDRVSGTLRSPTHSIVVAVFNNLDGTGRLEIISDTLTLSSGGSNAGDIYIHSGAVLRILGAAFNEPAGIIRGGGTLDISGAAFTDSGAIAPGSSPGTLTIVGALSTQGTIHIEVAGRLPGSEYDRLLIGGNADLGGTLHLSRLNGFIPTLTDTFRCVTFAGRSGEFSAVTGTPVGNGTYMEIAYRPTEVVQYVCNGISDIATSVGSITDSIHYHREDTLGLVICNQGYCPLEWTTEFAPFNPGYPNDCPTWEGVGSGGSGLLTRGQCAPMRVAVSAWCLPGTYTSQIRIAGNDPDEPLTVIPVQVIVPSIFDVCCNGSVQADFEGIGDAVGYLIDEGVFEPTLFNVYPDSDYGCATIPSIAGASAVNTITFRCETGSARMRCNNAPALILDGADHIVFDRIGFENYGTGGTYPYAVWLTNGADSNVIRHAYVTGASLTNTSSSGIDADGTGNDGNVLETDTVVNSYAAIRLGSSSTSCTGNEVRNCFIPECVAGIYLRRQAAKIHDNDIQPGFAGASLAVCGVYSPTQAVGDTALVYNNRIHNFRGTTEAIGVKVTSTTAGVIWVFNNFIYDWQNTGGVVYGVQVGNSHRMECHFNSIRINDVLTSADIAAVGISSSTAYLSLSNNVLEVDEPTSVCRSIYRSSGTLTSNYNCVFGGGAQYYVGCYNATNYSTLASWRSGTGLDPQSRQGDPGFCDVTDLHIDYFAGFVDSAGTSVPGITTDVDGDPRAGVPDIGADEYVFNRGRVNDLAIHANWGVSGVDLTWGSVVGARSYQIYRTSSSSYSIYPSVWVATTADTTYTHSGILSTAGHLIYQVLASSSAP